MAASTCKAGHGRFYSGRREFLAPRGTYSCLLSKENLGGLLGCGPYGMAAFVGMSKGAASADRHDNGPIYSGSRTGRISPRISPVSNHQDTNQAQRGRRPDAPTSTSKRKIIRKVLTSSNPDDSESKHDSGQDLSEVYWMKWGDAMTVRSQPIAT
jgi:hypothetical protein